MLGDITSQVKARDLIAKYVASLPEDDFTMEETDLPSGIDNSIKPLIPEPIYIPAVKDFHDELKTTQSTSFGKLMNFLLGTLETDLADTARVFEALGRKLNGVDLDGNPVDERWESVKTIEETIQRNLEETFSNAKVQLKIPPPEIKTILSQATIVADDGVSGPLENKGDGFKRAVIFSLIRSYAQLNQETAHEDEDLDNEKPRRRFLFLFEEPELYLHPRAQNILFEALGTISQKYQVVVSTHSPFFFSADRTTTFVKMEKKIRESDMPPCSKCLPINLDNVSVKDSFQLISYETSNSAFFSSKIVLVEGDSELIVLPHIARIINEDWNCRSQSISFVKVNGKGSFGRYKDFFSRFSVKVCVIADLDIILHDFDKLQPSEEAKRLREELLVDIDQVIDIENRLEQPNPKLLYSELQSQKFERLCERFFEARRCGDYDAVEQTLKELLDFQRYVPRREVLKRPPNDGILLKKRKLLEELRMSGAFVWESGDIEDYYPEGVTGRDKPSKAQSFCHLVTQRSQIEKLCGSISTDGNVGSLPELEIVLRGVME